MQSVKCKTRIRFLNTILGALLLAYGLLLSTAYAMDAYLLNVPMPQGVEVIYQDMPVKVNNITAQATHIISAQLKPAEIIDFYKNALVGQGWQIKDDFKEQNIVAFIRGDRFFYVAIQGDGRVFPCDVYLISSPADLALCRVLKDFFLQKELAGDVPGSDSDELPRYPGAKRRLNLEAPFQGKVFFYEADADVHSIAQFYEQQFTTSGWEKKNNFMLDKMRNIFPEGKDIEIMIFEKDSDSLVVNIYSIPQAGGRRSFISITKNIGEIISPLKKD